MEVTEDTLEGQLTYDDLFTEFFNHYLSSNVFPIPLYYNRLTGIFLEMTSLSRPESPLYGATDEEREKMLQWAKEERLPLFLRTRLFREYKLTKLLMRPLRGYDSATSRRSATSRYSARTIRGYSRQSQSYASSFSNSAQPNDHDMDFDDDDDVNGVDENGQTMWGDHRLSALYRYRRPGSRAYSLPTRLGLVYTEKSCIGGAPTRSKYNLSRDSAGDANTSVVHASASKKSELISGEGREVEGQGHMTPHPGLHREATFYIQEDVRHKGENSDSKDSSGRAIDGEASGESGCAKGTRNKELSFSVKETSGAKTAGTSSKATSDLNQKKTSVDSKSVEHLVPGNIPGNNGRPVSRGSPKFQHTPFEANKSLPKELAPSNMTATSDVPMDHKSVTYSDYDVTYDARDDGSGRGEMVTFVGSDDATRQDDMEDDDEDDAATEAGLNEILETSNMTLQALKQVTFNRLGAIEEFRGFLRHTSGYPLLDFWLDCEEFKDKMEEMNDQQATLMRQQLFRDMQDKYRLKLTTTAQQQIAKSSSCKELTYLTFHRVQYDVLRRLRAYWIPRYLLHIHRDTAARLRSQLSEEGGPSGTLLLSSSHPYLPITRRKSTSSSTVDKLVGSMFPSLSLACAMTVRPDQLVHQATTTEWQALISAGRRRDDRVKSGLLRPATEEHTIDLRGRFLVSLAADREAGGPFKRYLASNKEIQLLNNFEFWEDVRAYSAAETRLADRMLRMSAAWRIYNTYMSGQATRPIGISADTSQQLHAALLRSADYVTVSIFQPAQTVCEAMLEDAWIRFLKEDTKKFLECQLRPPETPPSTAEQIEVLIDSNNQHLIVRRHRPWIERYPPSTHSERGQRLRTALSAADSIDEARKLELRQRARERRMEQEKERKKAIKAAMKRRREAKAAAKKNVSFRRGSKAVEGEGGEGEGEGSHAGDTEADSSSVRTGTDGGGTDIAGSSVLEGEHTGAEEKPKVTRFFDSVSNKPLMQQFKRYMTENENKELINIVNLYLDVAQYHLIEKSAKAKRDTQAQFICKTYIEQNARKKVLLSDKAYTRMTHEKERPKTPTLQEIQNHLLPQIEQVFRRFIKEEEKAKGVSGSALATMSKAELALRSDDPSLFTNWKAKKGKHDKSDGRAQPNKNDKAELLVVLSQASDGHFPSKVLHFYKYLMIHGKADGMPQIDRDLLFYCECQKFKDASHNHADEELLTKKVKSLVDCFLESSTPPAQQVDLSADVHARTLRGAQKYLSGKEVTSSLFDEAQYEVFKELLPYWAGFTRATKTLDHLAQVKLTDEELARLERLQGFLTYRKPSARKVVLPALPPARSVTAFTWSLNNGIEWKEVVEMPEILELPEMMSTVSTADSSG